MATKRGKQSGTKTTVKRSVKPARPAARKETRGNAAPKGGSPRGAKPASRPPEPRLRVPAIAPARQAAASPSLLERAKALRDTIQRSKLTAPDPWTYAAKARAWLDRAERLLDRISANVETAEMRKAVEALTAEVEGDRDFQEAQRRS